MTHPQVFPTLQPNNAVRAGPMNWDFNRWAHCLLSLTLGDTAAGISQANPLNNQAPARKALTDKGH